MTLDISQPIPKELMGARIRVSISSNAIPRNNVGGDVNHDSLRVAISCSQYTTTIHSQHTPHTSMVVLTLLNYTFFITKPTPKVTWLMELTVWFIDAN